MPKIPFRYKKLHYFCLFALSYFPVFVQGENQEVEFDEAFLGTASGQPKVDLGKYRLGNPIPTGEYQVNVYVNGIQQGSSLLKAVENEQEPVNGICFTPELLTELSLKDEAIRLSPSNQDCVGLKQAIPEAKIQFDLNALALNLEMPQVFIIKRPQGYISPSQWQSGEPVVFVRYNTNSYITRVGENTTKNNYISIRSGVNVAGWAIRHQGAKSWNEQKSSPYQYEYTYAQRDIDAINGKLTLGDFSTRGQFFENLNIRGIQLESDERMLPYSLRNYAPKIEGIANSNARIVVRQDNNIIYETNVPAGPFVIEDIYPTGYSGNLEVEITEANGQTRTFSVPFSNGVRLIRPGQWRYRASIGYYREGKEVFDSSLFQGELQYGLMNGLTLNVGSMISQNYLSGLSGVAFETPIGDFSSDFIYTRIRFPHLQQQMSHKGLNIGYNAKLGNFGSYFTARFYRSFSPQNYNLSQLLEINRNSKNIRKSNRLRQRISFSFSQSLGKHLGSFSFSGIRNQFWQQSKPEYEYRLTYSNSYKRLQYQLGYSQSKSATNSSMKQFNLNFSWQFTSDIQSPSLYVNYYKNNRSYFAHSDIAGSLGENSQFNYSLSASQQPDVRSYEANMGYKSSIMTINSGISKSRDTQQMNLNLVGAVVAHSQGVTLSNDLGDTFAIIHAKGAKGAKINNGNAATLDWFGNGIVPYVAPYQTNYVGIDPNNIPEDVEIDATGQEIIPRANSAVLVKFATKSGKSVLFDVRLADGSNPPLAAEVFDQQNKLLGYVVQGGQAFVRGIEDTGTLKVIWGESETERCSFHYNLNPNAENNAVQCTR